MRRAGLAAAAILLLAAVSLADGPMLVPASSSPHVVAGPSRLLHWTTSMIPVSGTSGDVAEVVLYDDGLTWSWEEQLEPLDILSYAQGLPYNEWIEIDEVTTRRLFESVVQWALAQMDIVGNGGRFEQVVRQELLYFTPEFEYYWPPYTEDASESVVRWPVKIMRKGSEGITNSVVFHLGRAYDDERDIKVNVIHEALRLRYIAVDRRRYISGETGPPKSEYLSLTWDTFGWHVAHLYIDYLNRSGTIFSVAENPSFVFHQGNPSPVEDNTISEPSLEISGVECLFDLDYRDSEIWDQHAFQTFCGIINLCKLQLDLRENGHELERILWRDFFIYKPDWSTELGESGLDLEIAGVERLYPPDEDTELFKLDITTAQPDRHIYLTLTRELGRYIGYEWGVKHIRLVFSTVDEQGMVTGQEDRNLSFRTTQAYHTGTSPEEIAAYYHRYFFDTNGMLLTTPEEEFEAAFYYGQPCPYVLNRAE